MEPKKVMDALSDMSVMVKKKLQRDGEFTAFIAAYTAGGNFMAQVEPGTKELERYIAFSRMVNWFKIQSPYICIFGIEQNQGALVIAKTLKATYHLTINYTVQNGQYVFTENITNEMNTEYDNFLNKVYQSERSTLCQRNQLPN